MKTLIVILFALGSVASAIPASAASCQYVYVNNRAYYVCT